MGCFHCDSHLKDLMTGPRRKPEHFATRFYDSAKFIYVNGVPLLTVVEGMLGTPGWVVIISGDKTLPCTHCGIGPALEYVEGTIGAEDLVQSIMASSQPCPAPPNIHPPLASPTSILTQLSQACPGLSKTAACPACSQQDPYYDKAAECLPLSVLVQHINDGHKWTREAIPDWLDNLDIDLTIQRVA